MLVDAHTEIWHWLVIYNRGLDWIARPFSNKCCVTCAYHIALIIYCVQALNSSCVLLVEAAVGACFRLVCLRFHPVLNSILLLVFSQWLPMNITLAPACNTLFVLFREKCMYMCPMRAGRWQRSRVHLLGTHPVIVWEGCQVAASSLMTQMHNAVQEELVSCLNHLHAYHFYVNNHSWHHFMPHSEPQLLEGHFVWFVLSEVQEHQLLYSYVLSFINYITEWTKFIELIYTLDW